MVWETIEDDERDLAYDAHYTDMKTHYRIVSRALLYYLLITIMFVAAALAGIWIVFT